MPSKRSSCECVWICFVCLRLINFTRDAAIITRWKINKSIIIRQHCGWAVLRIPWQWAPWVQRQHTIGFRMHRPNIDCCCYWKLLYFSSSPCLHSILFWNCTFQMTTDSRCTCAGNHLLGECFGKIVGAQLDNRQFMSNGSWENE